MSDFEIIGVVSKEELPEGTMGRRLIFEPILGKVDALPMGKYLHVRVSKPHHVRTIKNLLAKKRSLIQFEVVTRGYKGKMIDVYISRKK